MAYTITNTSYMCRANKSVRLYQKPNDIKPMSVILPRGSDFTTDGEITIGSVTFLRIEKIITDDPSISTMVGLWITTDSLQMMPIVIEEKEAEITTFDDSKACDEQLLINGSGVVVYETSDSSTPITSQLTINDLVISDRMIDVVINGMHQTRYRISKVIANGNSDKSDIVGNWLLFNYSVSIDDKKVTVSNNVMRASRATSNSTGSASTSSKASQPKAVTAAEARAATHKETANRLAAYESQAQAIALNTNDLKAFFNDYARSYTLNIGTMGTPIGRMLFVHGMPFQYTHFTDRRENSKARYGASAYPTNRSVDEDGAADFYGRTFAKEIACNMPIAVIVPGVPKFLTLVKQGIFGSSTRSKRRLVSDWIPLWSDLTDTEQNGVLEGLSQDANSDDVYQYYSIKLDTANYYEYVNSLCRTSASLMGIGDFKFMGKRCDDFDWGEYNTAADQDYNMLEDVMGADLGISFAFDPLSSITDSITNSTGESQFAGLLNGISSKARELEFMTGSAGVSLDMVDSTDYDTAVAQMNSGMFSGITNPISHIATYAKNAGHGMNVRFPQIWNDSNSTKSYSIDMKFIAPYNTAFCKWRYVLVPFFHWFCLAAPHSDESLVNYSRPFLIKAFSKGYFNVEMGIISSLQWKRFGDGDMISADGIPTEIDVTVDFEDLYQQLAVSRFTNEGGGYDTRRAGVFFNNTGLMDLLGTLSGVNMNKISIAERMEMYTSAWYDSTFTDFGNNFMRKISDRVARIANTYLVGI